MLVSLVKCGTFMMFPVTSFQEKDEQVSLIPSEKFLSSLYIISLGNVVKPKEKAEVEIWVGLRGCGEENITCNKFLLVLITACTTPPRMLPRNSIFATRLLHHSRNIQKKLWISCSLPDNSTFTTCRSSPHNTGLRATWSYQAQENHYWWCCSKISHKLLRECFSMWT